MQGVYGGHIHGGSTTPGGLGEEFPPADMRGVPQPSLTAKDYVIILFMLGLWAYSIHLILRAWNKILSDGSTEYRQEGTGAIWWRILLEAISKKRPSSSPSDLKGMDLEMKGLKEEEME